MRTRWEHPGGKLREHGAARLSDSELLAILISLGIKGNPAIPIAEEVRGCFQDRSRPPASSEGIPPLPIP